VILYAYPITKLSQACFLPILTKPAFVIGTTALGIGLLAWMVFSPRPGQLDTRSGVSPTAEEPRVARKSSPGRLLERKPDSPTKMMDDYAGGASPNALVAWTPVRGPMRVPESVPEGVDVEFIRTDGLDVENLRQGDRIDFPIPQESRIYSGVVKEKHERFNGVVKVATGGLETDLPFASFSIVDDGRIALVMVTTGKDIYQVEIDKSTGVGTVLDDKQLDRFRQVDDGVLPPQRN